MLELLFLFCCGLMQGLGNLFGLSYQTVNVILFCYVEPIFTGLMIILAIMSLCKLPVNTAGKWLFRIVVITVILLLLLGGFFFVFQGIMYCTGYSEQPFINLYVPHSAHVDNLYDGTVDCLEKLGKKTGLGYCAINIIVYVVFMPALCIGSFIMLRVRGESQSRS